MTISLAAAAAGLFGFGTYLLLQRQLSRTIIGLTMLAHGANLLILLSAGGRGRPTFVGTDDAAAFLDPVPQAFVLTAIVISFGVTAFLLALAYRSWVLTADDEVEDDVEDRLITLRRKPDRESVDLAVAAEAADASVEDDEAADGDAP